MFNHTNDGVVVTDGQSGILLRPAAEKNGLGMPTLISVHTETFTGEMRDDSVGSFATFTQQLKAIRLNGVGDATLSSYGGFLLAFNADERGHIEVSVKVEARDRLEIGKLTYQFKIDQSSLPKIIDRLEANFLNKLSSIEP